MRFKRVPLLAASGVLTLTLAACGASSSAASSQASQSRQPITVGITVGLTGANSLIAPSVIQEAQLAAKQVNSAGGVMGRKLVLKIYDDQSSATGAVTAFNTAILKDHVDAIVSMETSSARNAGEPIALRNHTPYVYTSNYEGGACDSNLYIDAPVPVQMVAPMAKYFTDKLGAKTWFLIGSDYSFGRGELAYFTKVIKQNGGKVVGVEYNPISSSNWTSILNDVRAAHPDAVATAMAGGSPNISFLKQWKAGGFTEPQASLSLDEGTAQTLGSAAAGIYYPSPYFTKISGPANQKFLSALKAMFGSKMKTPNFLSVPEYYGILLYAKAVAKAKSTSENAVLKALSTVSANGPSGTVTMNDEHHAALKIYLGRATSNGDTAIVKDFGKISPGNQCPQFAS